FTLALANPPAALANITANGNFPAGQTSTVQDLVLTGTGTISGTVSTFTGGSVSGGSVGASEPGFSSAAAISAQGTYILGGIPAGDAVVSAAVSSGFNSSLTGSMPVTVIAGQTVTANVVLQATGNIQGTVTTAGGAPVPNYQLEIQRGSF